jgi:hypothetical protein
MRSLCLLCLVAVAAPAFAQDQQNPDEEWNNLPGAKPTTPPPGNDTAPPPAPVLPTPAPAREQSYSATPRATLVQPRPVLEPNTISMFGARSLGFLNRGEMIYLGFPLLGLRAALGVAERFDVGLGFDSFYTMMNEPRLTFRWNFFRGPNWSIAAQLEGGYAFFTTRAKDDLKGARWLTGRRNINISPGFTFSYQGDHPRAARLFLDLHYLLALDTEPYQLNPLGGVPASIQFGHNILLRAGAEMPLSAKTSFVFLLGLDVHSRTDVDSAVMPVCSVALVTSI